ncbi:unnamed protein product [Leptidea sinapis]|uniref:Calponin-homology (CH) domain-containing protein n=2 Tax=Leptidea sinapis TaxID=189913 RepID=A0A5E4R593_9NEOP|nr:unnamed protein product [Leptidea sinapis]
MGDGDANSKSGKTFTNLRIRIVLQDIENTPEHIRKSRKEKPKPEISPDEPCPRLVLTPFTRPPQVFFENVIIGSTCEKSLEIFNPSKQIEQITLDKVPPGLRVHLPEEWLHLEPETCYCLTLSWTPVQPTALRETLRFTNANKRRYEVFIILKSVMTNGKNQPKSSKSSQGKIQKKTQKRSPVNISKKKVDVMFNTTKKQKTVEHVQLKENTPIETGVYVEHKNISPKCPFDSPNSFNCNFNTSEVFSVLHKTYDKPNTGTYNKYNFNTPTSPNIYNVLKESNKQNSDKSPSDIFDNITFTPLKSLKSTNRKIEQGPRILLSINSDTEFDDSLEKDSNKENESHSIIYGLSSQTTDIKWPTADNHPKLESYQETNALIVPNKKFPDTSSPKEMNSPNFSINTDVSRISDLSFYPQRFSTERKIIPRINIDSIDFDEINLRLCSDTYTKESPAPQEYNNLNENKHPLTKDRNAKMCKQALFRDQDFTNKNFMERNYYARPESVWQNELMDARSPRSITPPLQSIPEESVQFSNTHVFDVTDSFAINQTYNKHEKPVNKPNLWSKKAIINPKSFVTCNESIKSINRTYDTNKNVTQNATTFYVQNAYSLSLTVDPFLSTTYFYDEALIGKFERDFKRWLNYILTPADLESNVDQKIDVGKAWIENRNKEVPTAPTKEKVCSAYHNSKRLENVRKIARNLLKSPEISQVFTKLTAQIDKKLLAIRDDRNLHLDIGLQKMIMELLLSYNPLWLRIGLEAIYGIVLPLKSNSDVEGLTIFIIQRMFKNPFFKNKHSKSSAPNVLLPAYMDAIKKFTLKKFFMLIFFLDQAKQKKIIAHDPCLFCRNAECKESRQMLIKFTRELIAGVGDITKHLRPMGYVVTHKQSYLDEYKYGVNNLAADLRDGVRLAKVSEIILMKDGLLKQLRTPAVSRLQKIHNVEVALKALRAANFNIVGDISASDIADGHREKTLSLLWQLIHVFRAPLFENAANVIQIWWKKKYEIIAEKRRKEQEIIRTRNKAATTIQNCWRKLQYKRMYARRLYEVTCATITLQKYLRMWICRSRLRKLKQSVLKIEGWYDGVKRIREAIQILKLRRETRRENAAVVIQSQVRRWLCVKKYKMTKNKIIYIQALVRGTLVRKRFTRLRKFTVFVQRKYRNKLLMNKAMAQFQNIKRNIVLIQSYYRMFRQRKIYLSMKSSVSTIEEHYIALRKMRSDRENYLRLKEAVVKVQSMYKCKKFQKEYQRSRELIIKVQRRIRANQIMKTTRKHYEDIIKAVKTIQIYFKSYLVMKEVRSHYLKQRNAAVTIQNYFRSYIKTKQQRNKFLTLKNVALVFQNRYRSLLKMRQAKTDYLQYKSSVIKIQRLYRANIIMKQCKTKYEELKKAVIFVQNKYRAQKKMLAAKSDFELLKQSCILIQIRYRAYRTGKAIRQIYLNQKSAAVKIQRWYRNCKKGEQIRQNFEQTRKACITIQRLYRSHLLRKIQRNKFVELKTASITIQRYYRNYILSKTIRMEYIKMKMAAITIQKYYRSYIEMKHQRATYLKMRNAASSIQVYYRQYKKMMTIRKNYNELRRTVVFVQRRFRSNLAMMNARKEYLSLKNSVILIQRKYRALCLMRNQRQDYFRQRKSIVALQRRYRALRAMRYDILNYMKLKMAAVSIQRFYRAYKTGTKQKENYLKLKKSAIVIQERYRAKVLMRRERNSFVSKRSAAIVIQTRYRAHKLMIQQKTVFERIVKACLTIQRKYRALIKGIMERNRFIAIRAATLKIQAWYRSVKATRKSRCEYLSLRRAAIAVQRRVRAKRMIREQNRIHQQAVYTIINWYITVKQRRRYCEIRRKIITLQSFSRMAVVRKFYLKVQNAVVKIQKYYRSYVITKRERSNFVALKSAVVNLQANVRCFIEKRKYQRLKAAAIVIQAAYRLKKKRDLIIQRKRHRAAVCLQKNVRRYLAEKYYKQLRAKVIFIQMLWKGKLLTRLFHYDYLQKKAFVTKLQGRLRGYLVREKIKVHRENLLKMREEQRRNWAATKIQALVRGNIVRGTNNRKLSEIRSRLSDCQIDSTRKCLRERNQDALDVLRHESGIDAVIRAFKTLKLISELFPMTYNMNATALAHHVYLFMNRTNRSITSIEVLKPGAEVLLNLARYKTTGPKIYRILVSLKANADRLKRMESNTGKHKPNSSFTKSTQHSHNVLPALEPHFGIVQVNKPPYFEDAHHAINCLFQTYKLFKLKC